MMSNQHRSATFNKRFLSPSVKQAPDHQHLKKNRFKSPLATINSDLSESFNRSVSLFVDSDSDSDEDNLYAKPTTQTASTSSFSSWSSPIRNLGNNFGEVIDGCLNTRNEQELQNDKIQTLREKNLYLQQKLYASNIHQQQMLHASTINAPSAISNAAHFYKSQHDVIQNQLVTMTNTASNYEEKLSELTKSNSEWKQERKLYLQRFHQLSNDLQEARNELKYETQKNNRLNNGLKLENESLRLENRRLIEKTTSQNELNKTLESQVQNLRYSNYHAEGLKVHMMREFDQMAAELAMVEESNMILERHHLNMQQQDHNMRANTVSSRKMTGLYEAQKVKDALMKNFATKKYNNKSKLARRILGESIATHPSVSFEYQSEITCLARAQLLAETGILDAKMVDKVVASSPGEGVMRIIMNEVATDILFLMHKSIFYDNLKHNGKYPNVYISADKGSDGSFVKILSWFDNTKQQVVQKILDVDNSYGTSKQAADAM